MGLLSKLLGGDDYDDPPAWKENGYNSEDYSSVTDKMPGVGDQGYDEPPSWKQGEDTKPQQPTTWVVRYWIDDHKGAGWWVSGKSENDNRELVRYGPYNSREECIEFAEQKAESSEQIKVEHTEDDVEDVIRRYNGLE